MVVFPNLTPRFIFKNRALSLLYSYGAFISCKKFEKTNKRSLRYLKTDGRTTDQRTNGQGPLLRTPSGKPGSKMKYEILPTCLSSLSIDCVFLEKTHVSFALHQTFQLYRFVTRGEALGKITKCGMRGMGPQNDNIGATYFLNRPDRYKYNYIAARLSYI